MKIKQQQVDEIIDKSKLRIVYSIPPSVVPTTPVIVPVETIETIETSEAKEPKERKKRGEKPFFLKEDWRLEQDKDNYIFIRKYYNGAEFRRKIRLTKSYWEVEERDSYFHLNIVGEKKKGD